jgi:hypothetical protein
MFVTLKNKILHETKGQSSEELWKTLEIRELTLKFVNNKSGDDGSSLFTFSYQHNV